MSATLELAEAFIEEAGRGIDGGTMSTEEIKDLLNSSREILARADATLRIDYLVAAGKVVVEHLEVLENIRRLLCYGVATGRCSTEQLQLHRLLNTKPSIDRTKGIHGLIPAAEWLQANRRPLSELLATIRTASDL